MKHLVKLKNLMGAAVLGIAVAALSTATITFAAPAQGTQTPPKTPPASQFRSGAQAKLTVQPGSKDAPKTAKLGATNQIKVDESGKPQTQDTIRPLVGAVSGVDFQNFYNYCYKNLVYTTVRNTTSSTKYIHVQVYNQGSYHDYYTSIAAGGSYSYPAFYGVEGSYSAYLYVWDGSTYQYDEYKAGNNTCKVNVTRVYNSGGWVQLKIQNTGTAYATQDSRELAPYPGSGTYTGQHYDYPVAGGAAVYRWFYVGTQPYGIVSVTANSAVNPPAYF